MKKVKRYITENDLMSDGAADVAVVIFIAVVLTVLTILGIFGIQPIIE